MLSHLVRKLRPPPSEPLQVSRANSRVWHLRNGALDALGGLPDLAEWERMGLATLVKQNLQRTIWRVTLPGGTVYVKHCRTNTPRSWIREILRPPKARLEFENALALLSRGIGCTEPLGWGISDGFWPGDSYIITREQTDAVPLDAFLERSPIPGQRRILAVAFGEYMATLRDGGVVHADAHPGNFLIEWREGGAPRFFLLDVHAVKIATPKSPDRNLMALNRWFQLRATRTDRLRFWRSYSQGKVDDRLNKTLELQTRQSNLRFWLNRLGRYSGDNREYRKIRGRGVRGYAVKNLPEDVFVPWLADPDRAFLEPAATILKDSRSSTVCVLAIDSRKYIFKRFRRGGFGAGLKNLLRCSPALRSWISGQSLRDRGLPTARPLAMLERIRHGLPREGYLIFEFISDAMELPDAVTKANTAERNRLADDLGRLIRDMHDKGVSHRDLKAPNILIADGRPVLIDLVGVRLGLRVSFHERVRNLGRLNASFFASPSLKNSDRLRFLRAYRIWSIGPASDWKILWKAVAAETLAKVEKNLRSGRVLA